MTGAYAAYAPYAKDKTKDDRTYKAYPIFWKEDHASQKIVFFGLDSDEIGKTPSDYSVTEPNGWKVQESYISTEAFINATTGNYTFNCLYRNAYDDPYPRSVWPMYAATMNAMQGALVNDYGYDQL